MQKHTDLTCKRVQGFAEKIALRFYTQRHSITLSVYHAPGRISFQEALGGNYEPCQIGDKFGPIWSTHWVKATFQIPLSWKDLEVHLLWDSSSEACIWQNGRPLQGLTGSHNGWSDSPLRSSYRLTRQAMGGEELEYYIEAACNGMFGGDNKPYGRYIGELLQAEIAVFNRAAWDLYWDLKVIADMAQFLPDHTPRKGQALFTANEMVNRIILEDPSTWPAARQLASHFFAVRNSENQHNLTTIGHAHIDTAWLWPIAETKRKCARTFATATRYMDEYQGYRFVCSQAQQFAWMEEHYPSLFERICEKVRKGQFIPVGGTWVEPDCNIPAGESLVRQFLYGQRYFWARFGHYCEEFWNPDVFGYTGSLPQIMKLSGIKYFLTQKLSWNQFNKPTSHTFIWEGIDGSRVLTHFPPADSYSAFMTVKEALFNVENFKDHERANESLMLFGYGDGGGGPTLEMLEQLDRMKKDVEGLPRIEVRSPQEFFMRCAADYKDPLVICGELYFEMHRGTYTTQAKTKKFNRQCELLLRDVEILSSWALLDREYQYPGQTIEKLWKIVLTNQFHDIIPGSSIGVVYEDANRDYEYVLSVAQDLKVSACQALFPAANSDRKLLVLNTLSFPRTEVVELPAGEPGLQKASSGANLGLLSAPGLGFAVQSTKMPAGSAQITQDLDGYILENPYLKVHFNLQGYITSFIYKPAQRQCIEPGMNANVFRIFEDIPNEFDAWDVDIFHLEKVVGCPSASRLRILESGPVRVALEAAVEFSSHSQLQFVASLDAVSARLDFRCSVDWHETHKFLKVEFPLNLRSQFATYEIQYGSVQRPTHFNTPYDLARFEVPAQRWADISEPDFGVALLNDCKYGYSAYKNVLRLSLLRAPTSPDPNADLGHHEFRYAIYPHLYGPELGGVVAESQRFNVPLIISTTDQEEMELSYFTVDQPAILVDTIKKAEDKQAIIIRCYESQGTRGKFKFHSHLPIHSAKLVNILEEEISVLDIAKKKDIEIPYKPFEIITLLLEMTD